EPAGVRGESIAFGRELGAERVARPEPDFAGLDQVMRRARAQVDDAVHGAAPGPYVALDLIEGAATWSLEEGHRREEDAIAELLPSPQAQASIYAFGLVEQRTKRRPPEIASVSAHKVEKVGIVGAGL